MFCENGRLTRPPHANSADVSRAVSQMLNTDVVGNVPAPAIETSEHPDKYREDKTCRTCDEVSALTSKCQHFCTVPYATQHAALLKQLALGPDELCDFVREQWPEIVRLALERFRSGYDAYGSTMYAWDEATWVRNVREECADACVYLSRDLA